MAFQPFYYGGNTDADTSEAARLRWRLSQQETGEAISFVLRQEPGNSTLPELESRFGPSLAEDVQKAGVLRTAGDALYLDCPVFLEEDMPCLCHLTSQAAEDIAALLTRCRPRMDRILSPLHNGFPPEVNLYHLLCGHIFDGLYFDYLETEGLVSTGRDLPSGFSDLVILYEGAPSLESWVRSLLCSYNRWGSREGVFQSFGDCGGRRRDFYQAYAGQREDRSPPPLPREELVRAFIALTDGREAEPAAIAAFTLFGYAREGRPCVPVYRWDTDQPVWEELFQLVLSATAGPVGEVLSQIGSCSSLTANRHGVPVRDTANEVYHLLFGQVNEALVRLGVTAPPEEYGPEGRYLKSFEIFPAGTGGQTNTKE